MYKIDLSKKKLHKIDQTILKKENLMERNDLQQFLFNSWENFRNDIGLPSALLIGQEIKPHDSVGDAIDLLAFDQNDSSLIVIELKRDKNKLQLLQSLTYAAMVATWNSEKLLSTIESNHSSLSEEVKELLQSSDFNEQVRIVLIAEYFDPEVVITADWLVRNYGLDISIFSIELNKVENELFFDIDQKYPLTELSDTYRSRKIKSEDSGSLITWEQILPKLKYDFAAEGIAICKNIRGEGDPKRRRFGDMLRNYDGFNWFSWNFREKYLNVYTGCNEKAEARVKIQKNIGSHIVVSEWRDGVSFEIAKREDFEKLCRWLKLK